MSQHTYSATPRHHGSFGTGSSTVSTSAATHNNVPQTADMENQHAAQVAYWGTIGHELRTPVATIQAALDLLQSTVTCDTQKRYLRLIHNASQVLSQNLDELLHYSHLQLGTPVLISQSFHLHDMIDEVITVHSIHAEKKALALTIDIAPDVPTELIGDKEKLSRILQNLLSNAIKFSSYGSVQISVRTCNPASCRRHVRLYFCVSDNGMGIDLAEQAHILHPFVQGKAGLSAQQGTGLGLAICDRLVQLLGGELHIQSQHGEGCSISFELEFLLTPPLNIELARTHANTQQPLRLLIVDDDATMRFVFERYAQSLGHHCTLASNTAEAAALLSTHPIDVLVLDIHLGKQSGIELAHWLRNTTAYAQLPIIFLSARHDIHELLHSAHICHSTYISKPLQKSALEHALHNVTRADATSAPQHYPINHAHLAKEAAQFGDTYLDELIQLYQQQSLQSEQQLSLAIQDQAATECLAVLHRLQGSCNAVGLTLLSQDCQLAAAACSTLQNNWVTQVEHIIQNLIHSRQALTQYRLDQH